MLAGSGRTIAPQTRWAKLPEMVRAGEDLTALYQLAYALFLPDFQERLLSDGPRVDGMLYGLTPELSARLRSETAGRSAVSTIGVLEQRLFLGERLLRDTDAASMAVSLETRLPLVDSAVVEAVARVPDAARFEPLGRKQLLRRIGLDRLDPRLFERPKRGFELPFGRWIRTRRSGAPWTRPCAIPHWPAPSGSTDAPSRRCGRHSRAARRGCTGHGSGRCTS